MEREEPAFTDPADGVKSRTDVDDAASGGAADDAPAAPDRAAPATGSAGRVAAAVALYVGVRLVLIAILAGVMVVLGLPVLVSLLLAIVLALPLSLVLFRSLRARMNAEVEALTRDRRARRERLRAELRGDAGP